MTDGPKIEHPFTDAQLETLRRTYVHHCKTGQLERVNIVKDLRRVRRRIRAVKPSFRPGHRKRILKLWQDEAACMLLLDESQLPPTFEKWTQILRAAVELADSELAKHDARVREGRVPSTR